MFAASRWRRASFFCVAPYAAPHMRRQHGKRVAFNKRSRIRCPTGSPSVEHSVAPLNGGATPCQIELRMWEMINSLSSLPNGRSLLMSLSLTPERLRSGSKIAVPIPALRAILSLAVSTLPFDEGFYTETYPDIAKAHSLGDVADLRTHFIQEGYFEGRFGSKPEFDADFYTDTYPDVAAGIAKGEVSSALDHYLRAGAAEGRFATHADVEAWKRWHGIISRA
jgi:hypothetical protein